MLVLNADGSVAALGTPDEVRALGHIGSEEWSSSGTADSLDVPGIADNKNSQQPKKADKVVGALVLKEDRYQGVVSWRTYRDYIANGGPVLVSLVGRP